MSDDQINTILDKIIKHGAPYYEEKDSTYVIGQDPNFLIWLLAVEIQALKDELTKEKPK